MAAAVPPQGPDSLKIYGYKIEEQAGWEKCVKDLEKNIQDLQHTCESNPKAVDLTFFTILKGDLALLRDKKPVGDAAAEQIQRVAVSLGGIYEQFFHQLHGSFIDQRLKTKEEVRAWKPAMQVATAPEGAAKRKAANCRRIYEGLVAQHEIVPVKDDGHCGYSAMMQGLVDQCARDEESFEKIRTALDNSTSKEEAKALKECLERLVAGYKRTGSLKDLHSDEAIQAIRKLCVVIMSRHKVFYRDELRGDRVFRDGHQGNIDQYLEAVEKMENPIFASDVEIGALMRELGTSVTIYDANSGGGLKTSIPQMELRGKTPLAFSLILEGNHFNLAIPKSE